MTDITIYHNNRCSKSRATLEVINATDNQVTIINYLETPPAIDKLKEIINLLGYHSARQLMRTGEEIYKTLALKEIENESSLLEAMVNNPKLIERPIVLANGKAKIGRPPESVLEIL